MRGYPRVTTMWDIADAMEIPRHQLMAVAGMIPDVGPEAFNSEKGVDLSPREAALIESFRVLTEDHKSIVYNQVVAMAKSTQSTEGARDPRWSATNKSGMIPETEARVDDDTPPSQGLDDGERSTLLTTSV